MASESTTIRTTRTYETRSGGGDVEHDSGSLSSIVGGYKATVSPRNIVINRSVYGGPNAGRSRSISMERSIHSGAMAVPSGAYALVSSTGVTAVKSSREKEKKDMQDLNERFAGYIEKVRFLEAQNKRLADELEKLKSKWGKETTQIKAMYQAELDEARRLLEESDKDKARLEIRVASLEEQLDELRQKFDDVSKLAADSRDIIDRQNQQLADNDAELGLLRRRLESFEADRERDKKQINVLQDALNRTRADLDNETFAHIEAENRRQTLEEELEFLKSVHEQELKELSALAYRDTTSENREFWKNEMGQAMREIQEVYDGKLDSMKGEMETFYNLKMQEFRTGTTKQAMETEHAKEETKRLRLQLNDLRDKMTDLEARNSQLMRELDYLKRAKEERERELENENADLKDETAKLRAELEAILKELQEIVDTKLGLELEIAAYRKLLEGEETRVGMKQAVDRFTNEDPSSSNRMSSTTRSDIASRTTFQRSTKGPLSIAECSPDGKFIIVENTTRKEESMNGWRLKRNIDGDDRVDYTFKQDIIIKPVGKVKLWSRSSKPSSSGPFDVETDYYDWGSGSNITTKLINTFGEERASHVQKMSSV
jgi:intermediate filament protein if